MMIIEFMKLFMKVKSKLIAEQKDFLLNKLAEKDSISFMEVIGYERDKIAVIFNFLAVLELMQLQLIRIRIGEGFNNFWIERKDEGVKIAHDQS